jgi:hypothetical protein
MTRLQIAGSSDANGSDVVTVQAVGQTTQDKLPLQ